MAQPYLQPFLRRLDAGLFLIVALAYLTCMGVRYIILGARE